MAIVPAGSTNDTKFTVGVWLVTTTVPVLAGLAGPAITPAGNVTVHLKVFVAPGAALNVAVAGSNVHTIDSGSCALVGSVVIVTLE